MATLETITGQCLCGAVKFTAKVKSHDVAVCHCSMCRKWSGGISLAIEPVGAPAFSGSDNLAMYRSSEWGERGFCKVCGSSLFWKLVGEDRYTISAGNIDDQSCLRLTTEIFIDDMPGYYEFSNEAVKLTGEEATAAFMASAEKD